MNAVLEHLDQVSVFGRVSSGALFILGLDWAFTAVHDYEENRRGAKAPLWRVFGAVVGVWVPNWIGFLSFTVALTLLLWSVGLAGIVGLYRTFNPSYHSWRPRCCNWGTDFGHHRLSLGSVQFGLPSKPGS